MNINIKLYINGKPHIVEVKEETALKDILSKLDSSLFEKYAGAWDGNEFIDFHKSLKKDDEFHLVPFKDPRSLEAFWHTTSHIMAQAIKRLYEVNLTIGPSIEDGFYYDMEKEEPFSEDDLNEISKEMKKIIKSNYKIEQKMISKEEAKEIFKDNKFKLELINEIEDDSVSIYKQNEFVDLCKGPHLISTGKVKAFKLLSVSSSYWRGDEGRESLQRIYGISYPDKNKLDEYLHRYEEAKKRDHRILGKNLDLFKIYEDTGPGLVLWHPKGTIIWEIISDYWKKEHIKRGYKLVNSPHIAKADLWKKTGHFDYYLDNMYTFEIEGIEYVVKPMNCPYHILIYQNETRSYRDLPIRLAELGTVYRNERSGVLHGMLRVRGFTIDDGHIFCMEDQVDSEIVDAVDFAFDVIKTFGYENFVVQLSVRDPEHKDEFAGDDREWENAEASLIKALKERKIDYIRAEGEAVFYGPKIDISMKDALGRKWQGPTIQFDFNLPRRLGLYYIGEDGKEHPLYMIHRALFGSMERFIGGLIEHYNGNFPTWLSPVQIRILTITDECDDFAKKIEKKLFDMDFRVELDIRNEKLSKKIRDAETDKIPYMFIVGKKEVKSGTVSVRHHQEGDIGSFKLNDILSKIKDEIKTKEVPNIKKS
jgi:threonyl-tRNA synthetase